MKRSLKFTPIFSKDPSIMKAAVGNATMNKKFLSLVTRIAQMSSVEFFHQEGLTQTGTKIAFLDIVFLA
jgi:hypothetical protein